MSASSRKQERKNNPERLAAMEAQIVSEKKAAKKTRNLVILGSVIFVAFALVAIFFASPLPKTATTAVSVEGHNLSPVQFAYYYQDAYKSFVTQYNQMFSSMLGGEMPAATEVYDEATGQTWGEFYQEESMNSAMKSAASTYQMYDLAVANGATLSEEDQGYIDMLPDTLAQYATYYGANSANGYLVAQYGSGADVKSYTEYVTVMSLAASYSEEYKAGLSYTDDDYAKALAENPAAYQNVSYKIYYISDNEGKDDEGNPIINLETSKAKADEMAEAAYQNVEAFDEYAVKFAPDENRVAMYSDPSYTLRANESFATATPQLADWLKDEARQEGDTTVVQVEERGYYVGYFVERPTMDQVLPNLRAIYLPVSIVEEGGDDFGLSALEGIQKDFDGDAEAFGELAKTRSQDSATASNGGIMANYLPGTITGLDESWLFDTARKTGDTTILSTEAGHYLFYYEGQGTDIVSAMIDEDLRDAEYQAWYTDNTDDYEATTNALGMAFLNK